MLLLDRLRMIECERGSLQPVKVSAPRPLARESRRKSSIGLYRPGELTSHNQNLHGDVRLLPPVLRHRRAHAPRIASPPNPVAPAAFGSVSNVRPQRCRHIAHRHAIGGTVGNPDHLDLGIGQELAFVVDRQRDTDHAGENSVVCGRRRCGIPPDQQRAVLVDAPGRDLVDDLGSPGASLTRSPLRIISVRAPSRRANAACSDRCKDSPCTGMTVRGLTQPIMSSSSAWRG